MGILLANLKIFFSPTINKKGQNIVNLHYKSKTYQYLS